MKILVAETYEDMSRMACNDLMALLDSHPKPLICAASGDSPKDLYQHLALEVKQKQIDTANWNFVGLDEWAGMNETDEGSCRYHLDRQLFGPLNVANEQLCFFNGRANDLQAECHRVETFIEQQGGIDVAIVGLGLNGHVGMNEPGTSAHLGCHIADIDPLTQQVGQKYFNRPAVLTHGLTLGMANLQQAKTVMVLVSGSGKADIVQRMLTEEASEQLPATLLRNHPDCRVYLDQAAAELLPSR